MLEDMDRLSMYSSAVGEMYRGWVKRWMPKPLLRILVNSTGSFQAESR